MMIVNAFETIYDYMIGMTSECPYDFIRLEVDMGTPYTECFIEADIRFERLNCILEGSNSVGQPLSKNPYLECISSCYQEIRKLLCRAAFESGRVVGAGQMGKGFPEDEDEGFDLVYSCILDEFVSTPDFLKPITKFAPIRKYNELYEKVYNARLSIAEELGNEDEPRICFEMICFFERSHRAMCRTIYSYGILLSKKK